MAERAAGLPQVRIIGPQLAFSVQIPFSNHLDGALIQSVLTQATWPVGCEM